MPQTIEQLTRERNLLAEALGDLLQAIGLIRTDEPVSLTGPELLMHASVAAGHFREQAAA